MAIKRYGNIYEKICDYDNIVLAHKKASKDKGDYAEVKMVNSNPEYYLRKIQQMLSEKTYYITEDSYRHKKIFDNGKERDLYKLHYYPHRIIQWAIILQIGDIFVKNFIEDTYASVPEKGLHKAVDKIRNALDKDPQGTKYCLKIDVSKYYPSIDNKILFGKIQEKIKDQDVLNLLHKIIFSRGEKGQPIGSLWSQYAGNIYLSELDHIIKEEEKYKYYFRYCDDIVILSDDKEKLHRIRAIIEWELCRLKLEIKSNYQIFEVDSRGIDFLGYRFFRKYTLLRKRTLKKIQDKSNALINKPVLSYSDTCTLASYAGTLSHCDGFNLFNKYIAPFNGRPAYNCNGELTVFNIKYKSKKGRRKCIQSIKKTDVSLLRKKYLEFPKPTFRIMRLWSTSSTYWIDGLWTEPQTNTSAN